MDVPFKQPKLTATETQLLVTIKNAVEISFTNSNTNEPIVYQRTARELGNSWFNNRLTNIGIFSAYNDIDMVKVIQRYHKENPGADIYTTNKHGRKEKIIW